jgi:glycosyltransferase involved in cell wall biosynthesis
MKKQQPKARAPILTICIPTVIGREDSFNLLYEHLNNQIKEYKLRGKVEILSLCDNKEMTIGVKRQKMYEQARGEWAVQIDDDDMVPFYYLQKVMEALKEKPDCIGYQEYCTWNGTKDTLVNHSLQYEQWADNFDGYGHVRTPFFKDPIRTVLCVQAGVPDMRFGEDHEFAKRIYPLLKKEVYIKEVMYQYRFVNNMTHNQRYGIQ